MISLRFDKLAGMTGGTMTDQAVGSLTFAGVSIDSRTLKQGQLFFALRGERHDGHQHLAEALSRGAAGLVVEESFDGSEKSTSGVAVIKVDDSHAAMLRLAEQYRRTLPAERVGITGSNGKTTTKEFTYQLLSCVQPDVYRSPGNYNNLYGIPLALFAMPTDTRVAIFEMGISVIGEMARLAQVVQPELVVITNVSATHLETLRTVENVAHEKLQAAPAGVPLIINGDDAVLVAEATKQRPDFITFGLSSSATFHLDSVTPDGSGGSLVEIMGDRFRLGLFGQYQVSNLLAAYAVARTLGYSFDDIDTESIVLSTAPLRGESKTIGKLTVIADCYNSNPEAVKAGLASLAKSITPGRRVIILGDMLELGAQADQFHRAVGEQLAELCPAVVLLVGELSRHTQEAALAAGLSDKVVYHFASASDCADFASTVVQPDDLIYLKGSRGIGLEIVLDQLTEVRQAD